MIRLTSRLFRGVSPGPQLESIIAGLQGLTSLTRTDQDRALEAFERTALADTTTHAEEEFDRLAADLQNAQSGAILQTIDRLAIALRKEGPEKFVNDLMNLELISSDRREEFLEFGRRLKNVLDSRVGPEVRRRRAAKAVAPSFLGISTAVDIRAVSEPEYASTIASKDYSPSIVDVVGVVSIQIRVDEPDVPNFFFQATRQEVVRMIDYLSAALKDLDALTMYLENARNRTISSSEVTIGDADRKR